MAQRLGALARGVNFHQAPSAGLDRRLFHSSAPRQRALWCWARDTEGSWGTYPGPKWGRRPAGRQRGRASRRREAAKGPGGELFELSPATVHHRFATALPCSRARRRWAQARPKPTRGSRGAVRTSVEVEGQEGLPARRPPAVAMVRARWQEGPPRRRAAGMPRVRGLAKLPPLNGGAVGVYGALERRCSVP